MQSGLETKFLRAKHNLNPPRYAGESGNENLTAYTVRTYTVRADTCLGTGGIGVYAKGIGRSRESAYTSNCILDRGAHLIHAGEYNHIGRAVGNTGHTVAGAVDIDEFSVCGKSIGTGKKIVGTDAVSYTHLDVYKRQARYNLPLQGHIFSFLYQRRVQTC